MTRLRDSQLSSSRRCVVAIFLSLVSLTSALQAQAKISGVYRLYQGDNEVGREQFERDASHFTQIANIPALNARLESTNRRGAGGQFAGFTLAIRNQAGDSLRGDYQIELAGDSVKIISSLPGSNPAPQSHAGNFDLVLPPQSVATLAELVTRSAGRDTSWRVLVAGGVSVISAGVSFKGDSATVTLPGIAVFATLQNGLVQTLEIPAQRARAVLMLHPDSLPPLAGVTPRPKPVYTAPPGAIYTAEEVRVPVAPIAADTFSLGCTLTLPKAGKRPLPAIVTITGSGSQGRDEDLWPTVPGYAPFRQVAERVARAGIATLRCDDRGKDASTGDASKATTADFAGDTRAQVAWLRTRPEIDGNRIGLVGHSEGGMIGPLIAAYDPRLKAIVIMAGPAKEGYKVLIDQARFPVTQDTTLSAADRALRLAAADSSIRADSIAPGAWYQWFYHYDPLPIAARVKQPTLILQGALDRQVTAGQADTLGGVIRGGGNKDVTVRIFPGLNHLFLPSRQNGAPSEYGTLKEVLLPAGVLDTMAAWLVVRLKR
jgi:dienelactone hydrolase